VEWAPPRQVYQAKRSIVSLLPRKPHPAIAVATLRLSIAAHPRSDHPTARIKAVEPAASHRGLPRTSNALGTTLLFAAVRAQQTPTPIRQPPSMMQRPAIPRVLPYLTGAADGQPKDAAWAAAITGVPADTIRDLARQMAATRTMLTASWSLQRADHGEQP
jgi:anaerobic selenocysteine-containing dehydrogenase